MAELVTADAEYGKGDVPAEGGSGHPVRPYGQREMLYVAIARALAVPLFLSFQVIAGDPLDMPLWIVAVPSTIYVVCMLWISASPHWALVPPAVFVVGDLFVVAIGIPITGGAKATSTVLYFVWTIAMSLLFPPRGVLACLAGAMTALALASIPSILDGPGIDEANLRLLLIAEISLAWIGLLTFFAADAYRRREERIGRLSEARRSLLADALSAEDRARRRLSQSLHDDALQTLLAAGQDLDAGLLGDRAQLERARSEMRGAVKGLRETIRGLHPAALEHGGLAGGLDAVTEGAARRGGFAIDLRVDPEASGPHDALIVSVVRELVTNTVKHAEAARMSVAVSRERGSIAVDVADDGRGIPDASRSAAIAAGHIGLASAVERVEAAGGRMEISSALDRGTSISISLPVVEAEPGGSSIGASISPRG